MAYRIYREWERITDMGVRACEKLPRTYQDAVKGEASHYYTNKPCVNGHMVVRRTAVTGCPRCNQLRSRGMALDTRPPNFHHVFHMKVNLNNRKLGFRGVEGTEIEE